MIPDDEGGPFKGWDDGLERVDALATLQKEVGRLRAQIEQLRAFPARMIEEWNACAPGNEGYTVEELAVELARLVAPDLVWSCDEHFGASGLVINGKGCPGCFKRSANK